MATWSTAGLAKQSKAKESKTQSVTFFRLTEPLIHVQECGHGRLFPLLQSFHVVGIKEIVWLGCAKVLSAIISDIKDAISNPQPVQVSTQLPGNVSFAPSGQSNHYYIQRGIRKLCASCWPKMYHRLTSWPKQQQTNTGGPSRVCVKAYFRGGHKRWAY